MPATNQGDINVISPENSVHGVNLGSNGFFNGQIVDVSDYTTVTITAAGNLQPNSVDAVQIEWYDTDNVFVSLSFIGSGGQTFQTLHQGVRTSKMRVRYHASFAGQTNLHVETLLRKGTISGSVTPIGEITGLPDAQITNSIFFGENPSGNFVPVLTSADPYLYVVPPPNRTNGLTLSTTASLTAVNLDPNISPSTRRWATIHNNTTRGNLYVRHVLFPSLTLYDAKIPPQHSWTMPRAWIMNSGRVSGIWDVADGACLYVEGT